MKISIVIATFNAAHYLEACLKSCIEQSYLAKEIVVIDGGSSDGTIDIIRHYQKYIAFWESERDNGIYDAWNKALDHITGTWVLFRGADDVFWDATVLKRIAPTLLSAQPSEMVCYGPVVVVNRDGIIRRILGAPWHEVKVRLLREMSLPHPGTFHHIDLFRRFGRFDSTLHLASDYDFLLRVFRQPGIDAIYAPDIIVSRMYDGGASGSALFRSWIEAIAVRRKNHISGLPWIIYQRLLTNLLSLFMRRSLQWLFGRRWTDALYRRRYQHVSRRLQPRLAVLLGAFRGTETAPDDNSRLVLGIADTRSIP